MRYLTSQITFLEIPDEISLSLLITGCSQRCPGCHSADSWIEKNGKDLDISVLKKLVDPYQNVLTCVLFLGGEWHQSELISLLQFCHQKKLKTALYTGQDDAASEIKANLDFIKTGSWKQSLGGLDSPNTNQKLINLSTGQIMNSLFNAQGGQNGQIDRKSNQRENQIYTGLPAEG